MRRGRAGPRTPGGRTRAAARPGGFADRVRAVVEAVPRGRVVSYGEVAARAGRPRAARAVGTVLRGLPDGTLVPWHRVVSRDGTIPEAARGPWPAIQRALLIEEGVPFDAAGRVDWDRLATRVERAARPSAKRRRPPSREGSVGR